MTQDGIDVLVLVGSPRENGRSAALAQCVIAELEPHGAKCTYYHLARYPVAACRNCGGCRQTGECVIANDGWHVLSRHMDSADLLVLVAPVMFAGPSGYLKAALERCQTYWVRKYILQRNVPRKRPAYLLVVGEGGDPFGSEPMEAICTSALNCANLRIEPHRVYRFIGDDYYLSRVPDVVGAMLEELR